MRLFRFSALRRIAAAILLGLLLLGAAGCSAAPAPTLTVYAFSAGAADAFLLRTANSAVMIDCAGKGSGKAIAAWLTENGIERLDCLIVTHFDKDHVGGAEKLLRAVAVDRVLQSSFPRDSHAYDNYRQALADAGVEPETVTEDLSFTLDGMQFLVDAPAGGYESDESNNSSLIVTVTNGADRLLFMGDAEAERVAEFLAQEPAPCDLLKLPHHGRRDGQSDRLIAAVRPKIALITSSDKERESGKLLRRLEEAGAEVFLTREGRVVIESSGRGVTARYETDG